MGDISLEEKVRPNELIEGPILPALLKFCGPVLVALFLQSLYGAVDLMVVGRFGDAASVSGVGTGSAVMQLVTMVLAGLTTGATVVIGRHIGERRPEAAGRTVGAAVALFAVVAIVLTGLMVAFTRPLVLLMQTPAEAVDKAVEYALGYIAWQHPATHLVHHFARRMLGLRAKSRQLEQRFLLGDLFLWLCKHIVIVSCY